MQIYLIIKCKDEKAELFNLYFTSIFSITGYEFGVKWKRINNYRGEKMSQMGEANKFNPFTN